MERFDCTLFYCKCVLIFIISHTSWTDSWNPYRMAYIVVNSCRSSFVVWIWFLLSVQRFAPFPIAALITRKLGQTRTSLCENDALPCHRLNSNCRQSASASALHGQSRWAPAINHDIWASSFGYVSENKNEKSYIVAVACLIYSASIFLISAFRWWKNVSWHVHVMPVAVSLFTGLLFLHLYSVLIIPSYLPWPVLVLSFFGHKSILYTRVASTSQIGSASVRRTLCKQPPYEIHRMCANLAVLFSQQ